MAAVGTDLIEVHVVGEVAFERVEHVTGNAHRGERDVATADALGHHHDVRRHAPMLCRKHRARPTKAADDLVVDEQDAVPVAYFADDRPILVWWNDHAAAAH